MDFNKEIISKTYSELRLKYEKLGLNLKQAFETFLRENEIPFLSIDYRVKKLDSVLDKIKRKNYSDPFSDLEDLCGLRIICFYQSDIKRIQNILLSELKVKENKKKEELLEANQFGYRSTHFIAQIKKAWTKAPNYRNLDNLKFEVQVRTVLMHSWAEIEHKLSYKSELQIPKELRRKFSRISAKLEEADEQFEEIKNTIEKKKRDLIDDANKNDKFDYNTELNLDTLQAFLDYAFPERGKYLKQTSALLDEMNEYSISFEDLIKGFEVYKNEILEIEKEVTKREKIDVPDGKLLFVQSGAARTLFEIINQKYFNDRLDFPNRDLITEARK